MKFKVGDTVRPHPNFKNEQPPIPVTTVRRIAPWGKGQIIWLEGDARRFLSGELERAPTSKK